MSWGLLAIVVMTSLAAEQAPYAVVEWEGPPRTPRAYDPPATQKRALSRREGPPSPEANENPHSAGSSSSEATADAALINAEDSGTVEDSSVRTDIARARAVCRELDVEDHRAMSLALEDPSERGQDPKGGRLPRVGRVSASTTKHLDPHTQMLEALFAAADAKLALSGTRPHRWIARARASAALPVLSAGVDHRRDDGWNLDQSPGTPVELSSDIGTSRVVRTRATWELDRLIFNVDELRAARALLDLAELKERIHLSVATYYQERSDLRCRAQLRFRGLISAIGVDEELAQQERIWWLESQLLAWTGVDLRAMSQ